MIEYSRMLLKFIKFSLDISLMSVTKLYITDQDHIQQPKPSSDRKVGKKFIGKG